MPLAESWVVVTAQRSTFKTYPHGHPHAGEYAVNNVKITKVTQNKPVVSQNEVAMKISLDIPEEWFLGSPLKIHVQVPPMPPDQSGGVVATVDMPVKAKGPSAAAQVVQR